MRKVLDGRLAALAVPMTLRHFEDIEPGEIARAGPFVVTREAIVAFAEMYDPQPFHLDEAAGAASLLGGLAASGWHTTAIGMRLWFDGFVRHIASLGSPGFDEVRWLKPVRPGDALGLTTTVVDKRASTKRPDRGYLAMTLEITNAAGEAVMTQRSPIIIGRRGVAIAPSSPPARTPVVLPQPPADLMLSAFYDEVEIGHESVLGTQRFAPEQIVSFAKLYDPQHFHLDLEAARHSPFGGLIASGWQTAAFWMKHYIAARKRSAEARTEAGLPIAVGGPSPGFTELQWRKPVHAGETITYATKITGKRQGRLNGWGVILTENAGRTPDGDLAFAFNGRLLWPTGSSR